MHGQGFGSEIFLSFLKKDVYLPRTTGVEFYPPCNEVCISFLCGHSYRHMSVFLGWFVLGGIDVVRLYFLSFGFVLLKRNAIRDH